MRLPCIPNYPIDYLIVLRWNHNTVQLKIQLLWENVCFVNIQLKTQSNFVILQLPTSFWSSFVWASKCWDRIGRVRRYSFFIPWFIDFISAMLYLSYLSFIFWLLWNISLFILWVIDFIYQRCHICLSSSDYYEIFLCSFCDLSISYISGVIFVFHHLTNPFLQAALSPGNLKKSFSKFNFL